MFNYRENQFLKGCILLAIVLLWGVSLGYIWGSRDLREAVVDMSVTYTQKLDEKERAHVAEVSRLTRSHRISMSKISARLNNIVTRIERLENANQ